MEYLRYAIIFIVISGVFQLIRNSTKDEAKQLEDGSVLMKMSRVFYYIGYVFLGIGLLIFILSILNVVKIERSDTRIFFIMFSILIIIISIPFILLRNVKIVFNQETITYYGMLKARKTIRWTEITKVEYSQLSSEIKILSDKKKIKVNIYFSGVKDLMDIMKRKLDYTVIENAYFAVQNIRRKI